MNGCCLQVDESRQRLDAAEEEIVAKTCRLADVEAKCLALRQQVDVLQR